ncbi:Carbohydrate binding domain protein [Aquisphaera giovannonii]|uniref:Carbohydrate binding domain protein n=1 Tax=Aquisphaera giovannonii TaxID=406548 RepID=A0A5B9WEM6_9BACT|nr:DUF642 domain-containing protein [Aquisphaera giovannonii]QEH39106.1 Carbohydrate binding domain protein [Aquisphaera giovannonii]
MLMTNAHRIMLAAASALVLAFAATPCEANLIVNGSFEDPAVPVGSFTNYLAGSTAITGWTVVGIDSSVTSGSFVQSGITFQAQDGAQFIDLAGITSNSQLSGVTQDIATTAGDVYEVSFYVGSATDGQFFFASTVGLSIDGGARMSFTNPTAPSDRLDWERFAVQFTATGATTNLTFYNGSAANNYLGGLDNVSVELVSAAVPEPSSAALLALGAAGVAAGLARRARGSR